MQCSNWRTRPAILGSQDEVRFKDKLLTRKYSDEIREYMYVMPKEPPEQRRTSGLWTSLDSLGTNHLYRLGLHDLGFTKMSFG